MATKRRRRGIYLGIGIGCGLILIPEVRKRVLTYLGKSYPTFYSNLVNLKDQLVAAIDAGVEAASQRRKRQKDIDNLVKFEADEDSPNYII